MNSQPLGCFTINLPQTIINDIRSDLASNSNLLTPAQITNQGHLPDVRQTLVKAISSYEWFAGMIWYYISRSNRDNFLYDITCIENETINYLVYEQGHFYQWHQDDVLTSKLARTLIPGSRTNIGEQEAYIQGEYVRKLSFSLQLSSPEEYTGGDLQFHYNNYSNSGVFTAPKEQGTLIIFDSRINHRVTKVKSGRRESLVGWVVGPRWK